MSKTQNNNLSTVIHQIKANGFYYDMLKGKLKKGSTISKKVHPIKEVEMIKADLLRKHYLKDAKTVWILKKPFYTGIMMARNLSVGEILSENDLKQNVYISPQETDALKDDFPMGSIYSSESTLLKMNKRHNYKLTNIYKIDTDKSFLQNHSSDGFGEDELYALRVLQAEGIVAEDARHGIAQNNEADIVDEKNKTQYEVVYESKLKSIKKKKDADVLFRPDTQAIRLVENNPFTIISDALINKFTKKKYSPDYKTCLVILSVGSHNSTREMMEKLASKLQKSEINILFADIIIISYDFINEKTYIVQILPCKITERKYENIRFSLIQKESVALEEMNEGSVYLVYGYDIFDNRELIFSASPSEIRKFINDFGVFV